MKQNLDEKKRRLFYSDRHPSDPDRNFAPGGFTEFQKGRIHGDFMQGYELAHKSLEPQYQARLADKDREINRLFFQSNQQLEVQKLMAENSSRTINTGGGNYIESIDGNYIQGNFINLSQDLTQAAAQIQDLLTQLQTQGATVETAQQKVATDLANEAKANPTMMGKLVGWGQGLAQEASKKTVGDVVAGTVKLGLRAAGLPLP